MVSLARRTLQREWRRFVPAVLAVAFAGLLLTIQLALVMGIFGSAALYVTASSADVWVGYPGTQSVNYGRNVNSDLEMMLMMNPQVAAVEPLVWVDADWHSDANTGGVPVFVVGIGTQANSMLFDKLLTAATRTLLREPRAVIVDRADLPQLGVGVGGYASIDGKRVHVVATISGLRALGGVNVLCSVDTARELDSKALEANSAAYWVAGLKEPAQAPNVVNQLGGKTAFGAFDAWTANEFALRSQLYWFLDTGAGVAVLFMSAIVLLVGIVVASQALTAVVISSAREYATLNALGVGIRALRAVVLEQAAWIGGGGLLLSTALSSALLLLAASRDVPVAMSVTMAGVCTLLVLGIALMSGLFAMRGLLRADPVQLLR
ncbi:MAG TPA: ABC transporter permease [Candidatus Acidoferrum sp.]|nr:ABC transporter permease [Candidatus Acidoferrum sp.]